MARPRIFEEKHKAINIYLQPHQYAWLKQLSHDARISPSAWVRNVIDAKRLEEAALLHNNQESS